MNRRPRGYVLLMVLLLLALASFAMAGLARASLRASLAASRGQEELQRRWGNASIERALLPRALDLMDATPPPARRAFAFTLGGQRFDVRLDDEQAKLNVNELVHWYGTSRARETIDTIAATFPSRSKCVDLDPLFARRTRLTIKPDEDDAADEDVTDADRIDPAVLSFGQLFDDDDAASLAAIDGASPADVLTCWGDGHLNFHDASRAALVEATRSVLPPAKVDALIALRAKRPNVTLESALAQLGEANPRLHPLQRRLADESFCFSLRVAASSGGRVYHSLAVRDESPRRPVTFHFDYEP